MRTALFLGLGTFTTCWVLHAIIWRIHRPVAYPIWLPVIFYALPAVAVFGARQGGMLPAWVFSPVGLAAALLHTVVSACYMGGYAGVIEYSPSAEILRAVRASMPRGVAPAELNVDSLSEQALTGKRVTHLIESRMAVEKSGRLHLTPRGAFVVWVCRIYRAIFGLKQDAKG